MYKALIGKEWIKTKWYIIGILLVSILLHLYMFMKTGRSLRFAGIVHIWDVIIHRDQFIFRDIKLFPLIAGIVLALAQYIPEVYQKRLKLVLHLPLPTYRLISWKLSYGLLSLSSIFILSIGVLLFYMNLHFSIEFLRSALFTIVPWYLAGLLAYIHVTWICLEPRWERKITNMVIATTTMSIFYLGKFPAAYSQSLWIVILLLLVVFPFVYLSVARFKDGK